MFSPQELLDATKIERASRILQPFTTHDYGTTLVQRAINDAFNVLQWGKTVPEEEAMEAAKEPE